MITGSWGCRATWLQHCKVFRVGVHAPFWLVDRGSRLYCLGERGKDVPRQELGVRVNCRWSISGVEALVVAVLESFPKILKSSCWVCRLKEGRQGCGPSYGSMNKGGGTLDPSAVRRSLLVVPSHGFWGYLVSVLVLDNVAYTLKIIHFNSLIWLWIVEIENK